jgi:hypothetical protein
VAVLVPEYTGYAEKAFPRFLQVLYTNEREFLPYFLMELIRRASPNVKRGLLDEFATRCEELGYETSITKGLIDIRNISKSTATEDASCEDKSLRETLDEVSSSLSMDFIRALLPDDLKTKGQEMAEAYLFLYCVENSLRLFIDSILRKMFGPKYFGKIQVNRSIRTKVEERKKAEKDNKWLPVRGEVEIFYLDFGDLGNIIQNNWDIFKDYFPNQNWITQKIDELASIRNLVAHNSEIDRTERDLIRVYYTQIMRQIQDSWTG